MKDLISNLFTEQLIAALADTLIYSLLAGVILAVVAGCIVIFTRKASAAMRYNYLTGALALFTIAMVAVFVGQYQAADKFYRTVNLLPNDVALTGPITYPKYASHPVAAKSDYLTVIKGYLDQNHNTIVLIWLLVICIRSVQLMVGLQGIYRLRNKGISGVSQVWVDTFNEMVNKLGIKQKVNILASTLTQVPIAIGHLRPLVLIPVGLMTALSTAEIEAILLHELAHIRRRDYLVNLLQNVLEIVFFFNPAVLWVSRLMRDERENCCDDLALAHNSSRADYIRALVNCEELRSAASYAMALSGNKTGLVGRVKRLISKQNYSLDAFEKTLITVCLIVAGIAFSAFAGKETIKRAAKAVVKVMTPAEEAVMLEPIKDAKRLRPIVADVSPDSAIIIPALFDLSKAIDTVKWKGLNVKITMQDDTLKLVAISQDGYVKSGPNKKVNDSTINQRYQTWLLQLKQKRVPIPVADQDIDTWYDKKIEQARAAQNSVPDRIMVKGSVKYHRTTTTEASNLKGESSRYNALRFLDDSDREYYDFKLDRGKKIMDTLTHIPLTQNDFLAFELAKDGLIESDETSLKNVSLSYLPDGLALNGKPLSQDLADRYRNIRFRRTNNPKFMAEPQLESRHVINRIILELVNDKIVSKDDDALAALVFNLDDKALVVNGKKQPTKLFKKYYDAFIKRAANDQTIWSYGEASK